MKILTIPDDSDLEQDLGSYGPACEGFVDAIKDFFIRNFSGDKLKQMKAGKHYRALSRVLEDDLVITYDNPEWVKSNLPATPHTVTIKALALANIGGKQITSPDELLTIVKSQLKIVEEIYRREEPFIELRYRLASDIYSSGDADFADQMWLSHASNLDDTSAERYYRGRRHPILALATDAHASKTWPVSEKSKGQSGFYISENIRTSGEFQGPTIANASHYASVIRELLSVIMELNGISGKSFIYPASMFYDAVEEADIEDMYYEDEVTSRIFASAQITEVSDLCFGLAELLGKIAVGLYVAMFDKHMVARQPALEGLFHIFKRTPKSDKQGDESIYRFDSRRAWERLCQFAERPHTFALSERKFTAVDRLYLAINGRPLTDVGQLVTAYEHTAKEMLDLGSKVDKDRIAQARILVPIMEQFERAMTSKMDSTGNVDQAILDEAMKPLIAATSKAEASFYHQFGKQQHSCDSWLGGNPFYLVPDEAYPGLFRFEYRDPPAPVASMPRADIQTLLSLAQMVMRFSSRHMPDFGEGALDTSDLEYWANYEWDRPVRHLSDMMNAEQLRAINAIYSHDSNTLGMMITLDSASTKMFFSAIKFIELSITSSKT